MTKVEKNIFLKSLCPNIQVFQSYFIFLEPCCDQTVWFFQLFSTVLKRFCPLDSKNVFILGLALPKPELELFEVWDRGERIVFWWLNTNTNIIRVPKNDRIRIRILFGLKKSPEYEYEYYSVWKNHPNTNTNIIWFEKIPKIST